MALVYGVAPQLGQDMYQASLRSLPHSGRSSLDQRVSYCGERVAG